MKREERAVTIEKKDPRLRSIDVAASFRNLCFLQIARECYGN
jgi:hypothetical protein